MGSLAGPGGTLAGAAIGGGAGHLIGENADLRTGTIQGEGAADQEVARWRGEAIKTSSAFDDFRQFVRKAASLAAALAAGWFLYRNRANIADMGLFKGLWHGFVGGVKKAV